MLKISILPLNSPKCGISSPIFLCFEENFLPTIKISNRLKFRRVGQFPMLPPATTPLPIVMDQPSERVRDPLEHPIIDSSQGSTQKNLTAS